MTIEEKTIGLTRWFFGVPDSKITSLLILLLSLIIAVIVSLLNPHPFLSTITESVVSSIFVVALPAFLTATVIQILQKQIGLRRILFISFIGAIMYGLNYIIYSITGGTTFMIISYSFVFVFWFFTLYLIFGLRKSALLFSAFQLIFSLIFFIADQQTLTQNVWGLLIKINLSAIIMLSALYYLILMINAPMKRNIGISSTDATYLFFEQWMFGSPELENMMQKISQPIITYVDWIDVCDMKLVLPYVHFGPFGNLGGSMFTAQIPDKIGRSIVFHAPVTREFNPATSNSITQVIQAIKHSNKEKMLKGDMFTIKNKKAYADVVVLNDFAIVGLSRAPCSTEDIDPGVGESIKRIIESSGHHAFLIDMHNSETNDIQSILPGSEASYDYIRIAEKIAKKLRNIKLKEVKIGYAEIKRNELDDEVQKKVGSAGIKVLSFIFRNKKYDMVESGCLSDRTRLGLYYFSYLP